MRSALLHHARINPRITTGRFFHGKISNPVTLNDSRGCLSTEDNKKWCRAQKQEKRYIAVLPKHGDIPGKPYLTEAFPSACFNNLLGNHEAAELTVCP